MLALSVCGIAMAFDIHAQILEKKFTIKFSNASLPEAIKNLSNTTQIKFAYSLDQLNVTDLISIVAEDKTLKEILDEIFAPRGIEYKLRGNDNTILLKKGSEPDKGKSSVRKDDLKIPPKNINGKITDSNQEPMAGVNIVVKGTTKGTTSDKDGMYSITVEEKDILVFSFIGYTPVEILIGSQSIVDIVLSEDIMSLSEVIVNAGYWEVKNSEKTGNIGRVSSEEINKQPVSNPLQALQGRIPGVVIQQQSGVPGGGFTVRIRGQNSLRTDGNEPLYIVDGVPYNGTSYAGAASGEIIPNGNPFTAINPDDIENIEVLKDADATAIYGSRGSNGVVLITTKKGKEGNSHVDVGVYSGFSRVSHFLDLLSTQQYLQMRKEGLKNDGREPGITDPDIKLWDSTRYTDWQHELIGGTAYTTNAKASVSGGNKDTQFLVGAGYFRQSTVFPGSFNDQKISGHVNVNHNPAEGKFGLSFAASYVHDNNNLLRNDITRYITLPPNTPKPFDEYGGLNWENSTWQNPYAFLRKPYEGRTSNLISSLSLKYQILPGLELKGNFGYNDAQIREFSSFPIGTDDPSYGNTTGTSVFSSGTIRTWNIEPQLAYKYQMGKGTVNLLAGTTFLENRRIGDDIEASGYSSNIVLKDMMSAVTLRVIGTRDITYRYTAVFGRINFDWDNRYIINLTARRDGSSRFGPDKRFANFGAIGAAWIFTNEGFLAENEFLSFGKLRTSYGVTGSDQIGDYQYLDSYQATDNPYQDQAGLIPTRLANASYSWEANKKFETALEMGLLKNRIQFSTSFFSNRSSNQLVGLSLPSITGFTSIQSNFPATVQNSGVEIEAQSQNIKNRDFSWTTSVNITIPRNKLIEYPNLEGSSYANRYEVGKSLYIKKMYHFTGVDPQTGLITFEDKNNNGVGTNYPADLQTVKQIAQNFYGGLQNSVSYKGFQLSFFFQFVKQTGYAYINSPAFVAPGRRGNQLTDVMSRWQNPGDVSDYQKFTGSPASKASGLYSISTYAGDNSITDASFVRLQNVYLSWDFPMAITKKLHVKAGRIYTQGQNVLTLTNYKGLSPETQSQTMLPPLRTITIGFQLSI
jgi:TonB-linked SusC/RagA family outer membrane protein